MTGDKLQQATRITSFAHENIGEIATLNFALLRNIASIVNLNGRASPGAIKVSFDGHVVCRRSEEAFVDGSAELGSCTESR